MGPRVFTRGNGCRFPEIVAQRSASMGPRVFTRGNVTGGVAGFFSFLRFNGATRLHAWKLIPEIQKWKENPASMGPRVFTRGNRSRLAE